MSYVSKIPADLRERYEYGAMCLRDGNLADASEEFLWWLTKAAHLCPGASHLCWTVVAFEARALATVCPEFRDNVQDLRDEIALKTEPGSTPILAELQMWVAMNAILRDDQRTSLWYGLNRKRDPYLAVLDYPSVWNRLFDACEGRWSDVLDGRVTFLKP
ncbi:MAG TPA: hypothetical protein PKE29_15390 [Phycisphaerales bacterium]|nr:hypothetical protein [Phycisphaerales bacterium]